MFDKLKSWIIGSVIVKKVIQKVAKHASTALVGILSSGWAAKILVPILAQLGVSINFDEFQAGMIVLLTGLLGGLWNYIDHRFFNKTEPEVKPA
jgi:hypothetical protein